MDVNSASQAISTHSKGAASVSRSSELSQAERIFCEVFVGNGGKAGDAARAAGYPDAGADMQACRLLTRQRVAAQIKHHCETFAHSTLPVVVKTLIDICSNELLLPKDRIKAANSLAELAGMTAPHGGVQVNVAVMNGSQAQSILTEVHEARSRRLSGIPPAMPDTFADDMETIEAAALPSPGSIPAPPGGSGFQGPPAGTCPVPAPPTSKPIKPVVSCECPLCRDVPEPVDDDSAAGEFRRAFNEGE